MEKVRSNSNPNVKKSNEPIKIVKAEELKIRQLKMRSNYYTMFMTLLNFFLVFAAGHFRDFLRLLGYLKCDTKFDSKKNIAAKIQPIVDGFTAFYIRHIAIYAHDTMCRPLCSTPSAEIEICERKRQTQFHSTYKQTGRILKSLNFASYNYLGFAQNRGPCAEASKSAVEKYGIGMGSTRSEVGSIQLHTDLENLIAEFLGKEDAITFGMGFITNAGNIPAILGKGCLLMSDELNHASIILGSKLGGVKVQTFNHNDMVDFEKKLRKAVIEGQPKTRRPWKKIIVIVEGIYSMEGTISYIPSLIALKQKYKFYIWLDEAHSIGAMGPTGRGVVEYWGSDANEIDIMMGTFSKSFGAHGGYIASTKAVVSHIRRQTHTNYASAMTPGVAMQIYSSLRIIMGRDDRYPNDGQRRIRQLAENTRYFRTELYKRGYVVAGGDHSPVVPVLLNYPGKVTIASRYMLLNGIAITIAALPAVPITESRIRFCLSASHTREMLDYCIEKLDEVNSILSFNYFSKNPIPPMPYPPPFEIVQKC
ncbi:Serine palmitoyltransferase 2-like [Oopsacas minuta]|uniref:serine C-palmitoyltransferase n=1 Tax=Oopsacas minuta TaxID=111878 RepID=A0AAV7K7J7_9METZ|nr:Serine palmitoyltransferase 2-like [Oopsacas minuta]